MCLKGNGITRTSSSGPTPITPTLTMSKLYTQTSTSRTLSIELWLRLEANRTTSSTKPKTILTFYNGTSLATYLRIGQVKHQVGVYHKRLSTTTSLYSTPSKANTTYVHYVITTASFSGTQNSITTYINGVAQPTVLYATTTNFLTKSNCKLYLTAETGTITPTLPFHGDVFLLAIYNKTLTASQVQWWWWWWWWW